MAIWANLVRTTLSSSVSVAATTIVVVAPSAPYNPPPDPAGETAYISLLDGEASPTKHEVISYTGRTGTGPYTLTGVIKGVGDSTDQAWDAGDFVWQGGVDAFFNRLAKTDENNAFSVAQRVGQTALTSAATITPDMDSDNDFTVTLGHNATLANPSNLTAGQSGSIQITQDGTGSRTLAYGSYWRFEGGYAPTLSTVAGSVDVLHYKVWSSTFIEARLAADYS